MATLIHLVVLQWITCSCPFSLINTFPVRQSNPIGCLKCQFNHCASMMCRHQSNFAVQIMNGWHYATDYFIFVLSTKMISCDFCKSNQLDRLENSAIDLTLSGWKNKQLIQITKISFLSCSRLHRFFFLRITAKWMTFQFELFFFC